MPPHFDPRTETRILKAAAKLWRRRGEGGLTLRAVAREAGTTTPTVYKRFRNKRALLLALARQIREQLVAQCLSAPTLEEMVRSYVRFAEEHPNEYRLLWDSWTEVFLPEAPRPIQTWMLTQLANRFGGKAEDYLAVSYGLIFLSHGAATLLTVAGGNAARQEVYEHFPPLVDAILRNPQILLELDSPREKPSGMPGSGQSSSGSTGGRLSFRK